MEMEDHHHHHHQHHEEQQYSITDLRQLVNGPRSTHFPSIQPTAELFPAGGHPNLTAAATHHQHYEMMMFGRQVSEIMPRCLHDFASTDSATATGAVAANTNNNNNNNNNITVANTPTNTTSASTPPLSGLEAETGGCLGGVDASTGRWPRQETLTLLEIRSRLDPKFKEANQKGPLWDEVSRIMSEEHGYQRSGKKCREKFENLYKYYKKTKEGKAGRQDGKHYRFFRQLEALYGENSNPSASVPDTNFGTTTTTLRNSNNFTHNNPSQEMLFHSSHHSNKHCDSLSLTNSTEFDTSSSDDNDHSTEKDNNDSMEKTRRSKRVSSGRSWKVKIKDFIDSQMRKLVEKQEEWLEKLTKTLEQKERERVLREEEWRRQEGERLEREHKFWAKERAWIEARDAALMEALQKLTGSDQITKATPSHEGTQIGGGIQNHSENNNQNEDGSEILNIGGINTARGGERWPESEITRLVQVRAEMETTTRFGVGQSGCSEEVMWEEIAAKMACFGYERTASVFREKWESISSNSTNNNYSTRINAKDGNHNNNKKRKENSRSCFYFDSNINDHRSSSLSLYNQGSGGGGGAYCDDINDQRQETGSGRLPTNDHGCSSPSNSNAVVAAHESCFPFLMSTEGGSLWENYSLKVNKANQNQ